MEKYFFCVKFLCDFFKVKEIKEKGGTYTGASKACKELQQAVKLGQFMMLKGIRFTVILRIKGWVVMM